MVRADPLFGLSMPHTDPLFSRTVTPDSSIELLCFETSVAPPLAQRADLELSSRLPTLVMQLISRFDPVFCIPQGGQGLCTTRDTMLIGSAAPTHDSMGTLAN